MPMKEMNVVTSKERTSATNDQSLGFVGREISINRPGRFQDQGQTKCNEIKQKNTNLELFYLNCFLTCVASC